ncbi:hypothetical protein MU0083_003397 [[Mycobacterium] kokjensenii]|uniref:HNH endonuclease n=1 Tax=[Mycobacterium] kokjensenii TaxID=3064287 RepID=A0ABN9NGL7_9MYCO|nr:hypothetical protein [Mycolicibacter sp. MU0083]CAJ1504281.1 hypothetical protein MU0083_003397 [Mycolicibacter sp. MU0083]
MTTIEPNATDLDSLAAESATYVEQARQILDRIEQARDEQPARLAEARAAAETARDWALIEEPWHGNVTAVRAHTAGGEPTATTLAIPSIIAKELFGARLAFDILDAGEDPDLVDDVKARYFSMVGGDPGQAFLLFAAALDTVASLVVPQMLRDLEDHGSNYDARVMLAEARTKAWADRVSNHGSALPDVDGGDQ